MANTITNTRIVTGTDLIVQQILINSDGTEETDLVIYDSSAVATALGKSDTLKSTIMGCQIVVQNAANAATLTLEYDATTDVIALPLTVAAGAMHESLDFSDHGGIVNLAGTGSTGDILLTTTGLDSGDIILMFLHVRPY